MRPGAPPDSESSAKKIMRSVEFYSALDSLWVPDHGVDFFGLFLLDILGKWLELFTQARSHLSRSVSACVDIQSLLR